MIQSIVAEIARYDSFLITSHESPDGDAVGSALALANYLQSLGKDVTIYLRDPSLIFMPFYRWPTGC